MAIPKKGLRKIEFEGNLYGWLIRRKPTYGQAAFEEPMTLAIQELNCSTPKVLYVVLNVSRPDNWISEHKTGITPLVICNIIASAKERGWVFDAGGNPFEYSHKITNET